MSATVSVNKGIRRFRFVPRCVFFRFPITCWHERGSLELIREPRVLITGQLVCGRADSEPHHVTLRRDHDAALDCVF